jgi:serine/threonine protein kinase
MLHCSQCGRHYAQGITSCPEDGTPLRADETIIDYVARDPLIGRILDEKYRLDERLGEGGMGTVYRATHLLIDRPVALKVLHPRFVEDDSAQQRFQREARAAGRLQHPNAVAVTDFGRTADGYVYIVMELLEGSTLRDVMTEEAPMAVERAVGLMSQIAAAVEAAHEGGVIHRDLKPGNIFVVQRKGLPPVVKVLDFGIAKLAAESLDDSDAKNLTQTGVMIGTPRYMSPEQCDGEHLTPASDVYSLGIILYEMLTGETPFNGASPLAVALQHSSKQPRRPRELVATIPPEMETLVLAALAKKPGERPADAGAFRDRLLATARGLGLAATESGFVHANDAPTNGDGKTASDRLVIDLEGMRESRSKVEGERGRGARTGETTMLVSTAEQRRATGALPSETTAAELSPAHAPTITRFELTPHRRSWLKQPLALVALAIALLIVVVIAASVLRTRDTNAGVGNVNAAASPSTTPGASPQPSPVVGEATGERENTGGKNRQAGKTATHVEKKPAKGNRVVRTLKKIFKNPF